MKKTNELIKKENDRTTDVRPSAWASVWASVICDRFLVDTRYKRTFFNIASKEDIKNAWFKNHPDNKRTETGDDVEFKKLWLVNHPEDKL